MVTLQIISFQSCGKTALCAGIGKKLIDSGKRVGYLKPIHVIAEGDIPDCQDAVFIRDAFELIESREQICPIHLTQQDLWRNLTEDEENFSQRVKAALEQVSSARDVILMEGPGNLEGDKVAALACYTLAERLDARVIMLLCYSSGFKNEEAIQIAKKLGQRLLGVVINEVPGVKLNRVQAEAADYFKGQGITVMAVLPESRTLLGVSVAELAEALGGEIITSQDRGNDLVENIMLGAMTPDSGRDYFNLKKNKAVITRSERADMMLAALETSTRCLVVSKGKPSASVMVKADDKHVPIMLVNRDINEIVTGIGKALEQTRFQNQQKLRTMVGLLEGKLDFKYLQQILGLN